MTSAQLPCRELKGVMVMVFTPLVIQQARESDQNEFVLHMTF